MSVAVIVAYLLIVIVAGEPKRFPRPLPSLEVCAAVGKAILAEAKDPTMEFACFPLEVEAPIEGTDI